MQLLHYGDSVIFGTLKSLHSFDMFVKAQFCLNLFRQIAFSLP